MEEDFTQEDVLIPVDHEDELTQQDVLLPKTQGEDLHGEITKAIVRDPATGQEKAPDQEYINRLQALAGMRR